RRVGHPAHSCQHQSGRAKAGQCRQSGVRRLGSVCRAAPSVSPVRAPVDLFPPGSGVYRGGRINGFILYRCRLKQGRNATQRGPRLVRLISMLALAAAILLQTTTLPEKPVVAFTGIPSFAGANFTIQSHTVNLVIGKEYVDVSSLTLVKNNG